MFKKFIRKYGYYMAAFALILVIGLTAGLTNGNQEEEVPNAPTGTTAIEMVCPMNAAEVLKWYSDTELFYNATLKQWESHKAVDLTSNTSPDVFAVLDGTVTDCSYSYEDGYCITISHADGLATTYCSLSNLDAVKKGDSVIRGQKIGEISTTATNESVDGSHLHFSVKLNGKNVDPANYITFENK
ncbi:MAG: M23 family metallopeptidase [Clostridiales bacterium]|nr:M23 family metallopeptidase [Clostridiales bacterium]